MQVREATELGSHRPASHPPVPPLITAEQPATEQPATEQPATEQPANEQPATEQPAADPALFEDPQVTAAAVAERRQAARRLQGRSGAQARGS